MMTGDPINPSGQFFQTRESIIIHKLNFINLVWK